MAHTLLWFPVTWFCASNLSTPENSFREKKKKKSNSSVLPNPQICHFDISNCNYFNTFLVCQKWFAEFDSVALFWQRAAPPESPAASFNQHGQIVYWRLTSSACLVVRDLLGTDIMLISPFLTASPWALKRFKHVEIWSEAYKTLFSLVKKWWCGWEMSRACRLPWGQWVLSTFSCTSHRSGKWPQRIAAAPKRRPWFQLLAYWSGRLTKLQN